MSTWATSSEVRTVSPESPTRARALIEAGAEALVPSDEIVSTRTDTEAGLGAGFDVVFVDLPGRGIIGGSGMDKLERV